ncbi:hypothetical protein (mitochondrion) [Collybia sordida]|uniref:Uncharacterized protein n=1 Tax=Collybia sordida TaxID=123925 RepID=A0A9C6ZZN7_9AGAR|nr:hypothetical protein [Collybia sordida]
MKDVMEFLNNLGIHVNISESSDPIVLFSCSVLVLSIIALFSFMQIYLYILILYISDNKYVIDRISKYSILVKIMDLYKKTRIGYIFFELCLFLVCMCSIIWLCIRILSVSM